MSRTTALPFRTAAALLVFVTAAAQAEPYPVGDRTLQLPAPPGLVRISDSLPALLETFERFAPTETRVIDAYLTPADHAGFGAGEATALKRYAQIAVQRASETKPMSMTGFRANLALMERTLDETMPRVDTLTREQTERGSEHIRQKYGVDVGVELTGVGYHGVYRRENWGLFFSSTMDVGTKVKQEKEHLFVASALALIDNRFMSFNVYAEDEGTAHRWATSTLDAWVDATRQANPDDLGREVRTVLGVIAASRRALLASSAVIAAGGLVVAIVLLRRRRVGRRH
jgi:hypothetical protein